MEDYIYILLAVVYILYSIIRGAKKVSKNRPTVSEKKPVPQPAPQRKPVTEPGEDFKKILEEFLAHPSADTLTTTKKNIPKPIPQPAKILSRTQEKAKSRTVQPAPFLDTDIRKTKKPAETHPHITQKIFSETVATEETPSVDFDIRQAIIFSEILKRPQY